MYIYSYFNNVDRSKPKAYETRPNGGLQGFSLEFDILAYRKCTHLYFCMWRICFYSRESLICSFTFTVTWLWVSKILKFSVAKNTLFAHIGRERKHSKSFFVMLLLTLLVFTSTHTDLLVLSLSFDLTTFHETAECGIAQVPLLNFCQAGPFRSSSSWYQQGHLWVA